MMAGPNWYRLVKENVGDKKTKPHLFVKISEPGAGALEVLELSVEGLAVRDVEFGAGPSVLRDSKNVGPPDLMLQPLLKLLLLPTGEPALGAVTGSVIGVVALEVQALDLDDGSLEPSPDRRVCGEVGEALREALFDGAVEKVEGIYAELCEGGRDTLRMEGCLLVWGYMQSICL